ncbi:MAG: FAD-dependent oxidoreductase [Planctomycetota bacterium]
MTDRTRGVICSVLAFSLARARAPHARRHGLRRVVTGLLLLLQLPALASAAAPQAGLPRPETPEAPEAPETLSAEVVVYGGTSAGVAAAVQVARMGRKVLLVSPDAQLGGLSTAGLGFTDVGRREVVGGLGREFYRRLGAWYRKPEAWPWQARESFTFRVQHAGNAAAGQDDGAVWVFEPSAAQAVVDALVAEAGVPVVRARMDRASDATDVEAQRVRAITLVDGRRVEGRVFIDATYEGDLFAAAGVSYVVGREPNARYGETLNGVQHARATKHQFPDGIDPYLVEGDPSSGFLPGLDLDAPDVVDGAGDARMQAFCFRLCLTNHPENRAPFARPAGYDERDYELLFRLIATGYTKPWITFSGVPNRKTDTNNHGPFSSDAIGLSHEWPEASDARREALFAAHKRYQEGLLWTLAHHERVPAEVRAQFADWGLAKDEFTATGNWPDRIYVREGRRMVGEEVMTELHCLGKRVAEWPVGMAAYTMDSHNVRRTVRPGPDGALQVMNEGDVQVGGFGPYPIGFGALVPQRDECTNLIVPVGLSATHMAFGSIRMEPVFFVLGQSAGTAAVHAIEEDVDVQALDRARLTARLLADGQILARPE